MDLKTLSANPRLRRFIVVGEVATLLGGGYLFREAAANPRFLAAIEARAPPVAEWFHAATAERYRAVARPSAAAARRATPLLDRAGRFRVAPPPPVAVVDLSSLEEERPPSPPWYSPALTTIHEALLDNLLPPPPARPA